MGLEDIQEEEKDEDENIEDAFKLEGQKDKTKKFYCIRCDN